MTTVLYFNKSDTILLDASSFLLFILIYSFTECSKHSDIKIHRMNIDRDHIHFIISFPTKYSIDQTIRRMKQFSTNYIYTHCNDHIRKFYRKSKRILWSDSYFCSTIGQVSESIVDEYIKNQG